MAASRPVPLRTARLVRSARLVAGLTVALGLVGIATSRSGSLDDPVQTAVLAACAATFACVGAFLVGRLPHHRVAWLLLWGGAWTAISVAAAGISDYGLVVRPGSVPGAVWLAWLAECSWAPYVAAFALLPLYFPTGSPPGRRWRIVGGLGVAFMLVGWAQSALLPWSPDPYRVLNPTQLWGGPGLLAVVNGASYTLTVTTLVLAGLSVVVRYRHATPTEAAQLRWFASAAVLGLTAGAAAISISTLAPATPAWQTAGYVIGLLSFVAVLLVPIAIGIAIVRYHLYDIDRIVSRTIGWSIVTGTLIGVFVAVVAGLEALLAGVTQGQTFAVAASTLVAFALFQPLRRRVQRLVDGRFYRARFDAQRTVDVYGQRLRDQVNLDAIQDITLHTLVTTVQPAHAGVWLRPRTAPVGEPSRG